jgi:iron complex transport system ATP-binding protein
VPRPESGLVLDGVTAGYGQGDVVRGVSLRVAPGEVVGLIGPNGSGKTTLVRVASRGLAPTEGVVLLNGKDPYRLSSRRAARLAAVVPQDVAPAFAYTVLEVVLMGRSPYLSPWGGGGADDWALARRAMSQANVQHLADRTVDELSGGERQRVVLAQALAQDAPILLLDEPTTHLDLRHVVDMLSLVWLQSRSEGRATLAIFHDLNLAGAYCDRIYALMEGRVVASGSPRDVITSDLLRRVFEADVDVMQNPATGLPTVIPPGPRRSAGTRSQRAHVIGGAGTGAAAMRILAEAGFEVTAGVLHAGDTDDTVAERMDVLKVSVPPYSLIDDAASADCLALIREAALVVMSDPPVGPGNLENLRLALRAVNEGIEVVLIDRIPIEDRDFTGGEATTLWRRLAGLSFTVPSDEVLAARVREAAVRARTG